MIRVNVLCEGATEEQFVNKVLYPHFIAQGIILTARSLDGGFAYGRLRHQIIQWLNEDKSAYVTTLVDLYGMNNDYPGYLNSQTLDAQDKAITIEAAVKAEILGSPKLHNQKFIPYFQLHEFEALLFAEPATMEEWLSLDHTIPVGSFSTIRDAFDSPEHINDSPHTAPSKRILAIVPAYDKVIEGILITQEIGLSNLRAACPHFDSFCTTLENLAPSSNP